MSEVDEVAGIIGEIEAGKSAHEPVDETEVGEAKAEGAESGSSTEAEETQKEASQEEKQTESKEAEKQDTGKSEEEKSETEATSTETDAHSQTETEASSEVDWKATLPPPPAEYAGKQPEVDDNGQIVNMTPQEYTQYVSEMAKLEYRKEAHAQTVEARALAAAEQILPEIKTNPAIRQIVESTRIASILSGADAIDTVQAAKLVKEALGITPQKLAEAKAEGNQNAKASIEIQKNAALETGSTQKAAEPDKVKELQARIKRGDDNAFAELLGIWDKDGKL